MSVKVRPYEGNRWEVDVIVGLPNGQRLREKKVLAMSKSAAQRWAEQRERHLLQHGPEKTKKEVATVRTFASRFIKEHAEAERHKPGGIAHKEGIIRNHLLPIMGDLALDGIRPADVQRLKRSMVDRSTKTLNNCLTVLNMMLKKAVEWGEIKIVPCPIRLVKTTSAAIDFYDFDEYERLVAAAREIGPLSELSVLLGGDGGLRAGEMRALLQNDVNWHTKQACIERSEWHGHITLPKGGRLRYVPLTDRLFDALQRSRHLRSPLVLSQPDGRPLTENALRHVVLQAAKRAGLRNKGPHILRHTFCSHLAMQGAPVTAIKDLAGHRDLSTTMRYMHLTPAALDSAIRLLDAAHVRPSRGGYVEAIGGEAQNVNG